MTSRDRAPVGSPLPPSPPPADVGPRRLLLWVGAILGTSLLVHAVALTYVFTAQTDLVRGDYYEAGLAHEDELAVRRASAAMGWHVHLVPGDTDGSARLVVSADHPPPTEDGTVAAPPAAVARLYRAADAHLDRLVPLVPHAPSAGQVDTDRAGWRWHAELGQLASGAWRLRVEVDAARPLAHDVRLAWPAVVAEDGS